ncbi:MAG: sensor histidine kinase, partial [Flavobacteriaceae bacterium]|nr:sensor histidine kinase [Flavobacteriaceae bacterium]
MRSFIKYFIWILVLLHSDELISQHDFEMSQQVEKSFLVKGLVYEKTTRKPITNVNILVNSGNYTTTNALGEFSIKVKKGDELIIKHKDFETVYYIIESSEDLRIEVEEEEKYLRTSNKIYNRNASSFNSLIDSTKVYRKSNPEKSIQFITEALSESISAKHNSEAYETLADIYLYWNQFDLAVTNYEISMQSNTTVGKKLKLANALRLNKNYQESLNTYNDI